MVHTQCMYDNTGMSNSKVSFLYLDFIVNSEKVNFDEKQRNEVTQFSSPIATHLKALTYRCGRGLQTPTS